MIELGTAVSRLVLQIVPKDVLCSSNWATLRTLTYHVCCSEIHCQWPGIILIKHIFLLFLEYHIICYIYLCIVNSVFFKIIWDDYVCLGFLFCRGFICTHMKTCKSYTIYLFLYYIFNRVPFTLECCFFKAIKF